MPSGQLNATKTECPRGHPYDEANTRISRAGTRNCRACRREDAAAARMALRAQPYAPAEGRVCSSCKLYKQADAFFRSTGEVGGLHRQCRRCKRDGDLRRLFGISLELYEELLDQQGGWCAICRRPESIPGRSLCVDHDHATGDVRGLLCMRCNRLVGQADDDPALLRNAAGYLELLQSVRQMEFDTSKGQT